MWKFIMYTGMTILFLSFFGMLAAMFSHDDFFTCCFLFICLISFGIALWGFHLRPRYDFNEKDKLPDDWESYEMPYQGSKFDIKEIIDYVERNKK